MKKLNFVVLAAIAVTLIFTSCEKDNPAPVAPVVTDDNADNTFSQLTEAQNKEHIQKSGIQFIQAIAPISDLPVFDACEGLMTFIEKSDPLTGKPLKAKKVAGLETVSTLASYDDNPQVILKSMTIYEDSEPETIAEVYNEVKGTYIWNPTNYTWTVEKGGDAVIMKFPSKVNGTSNNATLTVLYSGALHTNRNDVYEDYDGDLPTSVSISLTADGNTLMSITSNFGYTTNGTPTSESHTLTLGEFTFVLSANNSNTNADAAFEMKKGTTVLASASADLSGNWTDDNIADSEEYHYYKSELYMDTVDGMEQYYLRYIETTKNDPMTSYVTYEQHMEDILNHSNFKFQVMDIKVLGTIQFDKLIIAENEAYGKYQDTALTSNYPPGYFYDYTLQYNKEYHDAINEAYNKYMKFTLRDAANNQIMALGEAYTTERSYKYMTYEYNKALYKNEIVEKELITYDTDYRFVFGDGSNVDADVYFESGFDALVSEFETYAKKVERKMDSYME